MKPLCCLMFAILALSGCARPPELAATEVLNEANCRGAEQGMRQATYADVAALRGTTLLGVSAPQLIDTPELLLLILSRGRQPTPGYRLELLDAVLEDGSARLEVHWHSPAADAALAQIITYPCMVVGLESGQFDVVRAFDQNDELIGELKVTL